MKIIKKLGISPGPWNFDMLLLEIQSKNGKIMICEFASSEKPDPTLQGDMKLVAAAPELLEELIDSILYMEETETSFVNSNGIGSGMKTAKRYYKKLDTLNKATGKTWKEIKELL